MSESIVQKKLARLIQQELGDIVGLGSQLMPGAMITFSVIRVTGDLGLAKVYVTVFPDAKLLPTVEILNERSWELRKMLASRIRNKVRKIPELRFYADDSFLESDKIDRLLNNLPSDEENFTDEEE